MFIYLTLASAICINTIFNGINNHAGKKWLRGNADRFLFLAFVNSAAAVVAVAMAVPRGIPSAGTFAFGAAMCVLLITQMVLGIRALATGPMALVNLIVCCSMLLPALSGAMFWGESVAAPQWAGIALMIVALALCTGVFDKKESAANRGWVVMSLLTAIATGCIGLLQKAFQKSGHPEEVAGFIAVFFVLAAIAAFIAWAVLKRNVKVEAPRLKIGPTFIGVTILAGVLLGGLNFINLWLVGVLPSVLFFPVHNGSVILLTALAGRFLFKEKMSRLQLLGFIAGVAAILLLGNIVSLFK